MSEHVSSLTILCIVISLVICFALPIGGLLYFRIRKKADWLPFFVGCGVMLLFALILESTVHRAVLLSSPAGSVIQKNVWLYALYGGLMAALFEETGRLIAFRTVLKPYQKKDINALMYGAGHGGFEAAAIIGVTMINNLIWAVMINSGNASLLTESVTGSAKAQVEAQIAQLVSLSPGNFLLGGVERILTVVLQISLSVLVWFAAKNKGQMKLYVLAIAIHFIVDAAAVVLQQLFGVSPVAMEAIILAMVIVGAVIARRVWNKQKG